MIQARCYSDDRNVDVEFDATLWWAQASEEQKQALRDCGWGGDYPADEVAIFMADHDEGVKRMFTYLEIIDIGFECHVEPVEEELA